MLTAAFGGFLGLVVQTAPGPVDSVRLEQTLTDLELRGYVTEATGLEIRIANSETTALVTIGSPGGAKPWGELHDDGHTAAAHPWQHRVYETTPFVRALPATAMRVTTSGLAVGWSFVVLIEARWLGPVCCTDWTVEIRPAGARATVPWRGVVPRPASRIIAVAPHAAGSVRDQRSGIIGTDTFRDAGAEIRLTTGSALSLRGTFRPTYAEVEPDEQRINLTRYPLFDRERRPGFVELDRRFDPIAGDDFALFRSRRIGFDSLGRPAAVLGEAHVAARAAGVSIDAFGAVVDETRNQRGQQYAAIRLSRRFGPLRLGGLALQRSSPTAPFLDRHRTVAGDASLALGRTWSVGGWTALTDSPRLIGGNQGFGLRLDAGRGATRTRLGLAQYGEFFVPEVGFLLERGLRRFDAETGIPFGRLGPFRAVDTRWAYWRHFRLGDGFHLGSAWRGSASLRLGASTLEPSVTRRHEGLLDPLPLADSVTLRRGHYRWTELGLTARTRLGSSLALDGRVDGGGFYDGSQLRGALAIEWHVGRAIELGLLTDVGRLRTSRGQFDRILIAHRLRIRPTASISAEALVQYHNTVRLWTANARLAWRDRHGTGLMLALTDDQEADRPWRWVRPQVRTATIKASRTIGVGRVVGR